MATRSTIAIELPNGTVEQIYCHWDGYIDHNGQILFENYTKFDKVRELISLGDISCLRTEIGEAHDFDARYNDEDPRSNWCVAYGRDRGEKDTQAKTFKSFEDYAKNHQCEEYEYIFMKDGLWMVSCYGRPFIMLEHAIADLDD